MNGTSFLLLLVFLVAGYVIQPLVLPKLQDSGFGVTTTKETDKKKKITDSTADDDSNASAQPNPEPNPEPRITDEPTTPAETDSDVSPKPEPQPEPMPEPQPEPGPVPTSLTDAQLVEAMQSSIKSGSITEFQFSQVTGWKSAGEETIGGENYKVGVASYTAKTLFGDQTHDAKALFKDGKLVKWVWAANNFEMK